MKVHVTINDMDQFDEVMELAKEAIQERGSKKADDIVQLEPQVDVLPHGGAEFDGETFNEYVLGSWRIGKD